MARGRKCSNACCLSLTGLDDTDDVVACDCCLRATSDLPSIQRGWLWKLCSKILVQHFETAKVIRRYSTLERIEALMEHAEPHLGALALFMFLTDARGAEQHQTPAPDPQGLLVYRSKLR